MEELQVFYTGKSYNNATLPQALTTDFNGAVALHWPGQALMLYLNGEVIAVDLFGQVVFAPWLLHNPDMTDEKVDLINRFCTHIGFNHSDRKLIQVDPGKLGIICEAIILHLATPTHLKLSDRDLIVDLAALIALR